MNRFLSFLTIAGFLVTSSHAVAQDTKPKADVLVKIPLEPSDKIAAKSGKWSEPTPITGSDDLMPLVGDVATRKKILDAIDFKTHVLLVFAWSGSGGDVVEGKITDDTPAEARFSLKPGATDDVRSHVQLFAVKKETRWIAK